MLPQERPELIPREEESNEFVVALECRENDGLWLSGEMWRTFFRNCVSFFEGAMIVKSEIETTHNVVYFRNQFEPHVLFKLVWIKARSIEADREMEETPPKRSSCATHAASAVPHL